MSQSEIERVLEDRRRELERELEALTDVPRDPMATVSFGKRIGEGTTEAVERINTTSAARALDAMLDDVRRALAKLADGSYGTCDSCGRAIPRERLDAIPWAVLCVTCAGARGGRRRGVS
ncbi:MAG: TraR/DksA family transcriptional regulator [Actinobacteria bacterium]|nr:MAG: TraR/DksA family transcriptional regulator [Actinomycetota bacterium]